MRIALVIAFLLVASNAAAADWYDTAWPHRISVTVQESKVSGTTDLTNHPVWVHMQDVFGEDPWDNLFGMDVDGLDIVVTDSTGTTKLERELTSMDASAPTGELFFKAPVIKAATNTVFYIYWGNTGANESNSNAVWTGNKYVLHAEDNTDSSPSGLTATLTSVGYTTGQVGNGFLFNAAGDRFFLNNSADSDSVWTLLMSVQMDGTASGYLNVFNTNRRMQNTGTPAPFNLSYYEGSYNALFSSFTNNTMKRLAVVFRGAVTDSVFAYSNGTRVYADAQESFTLAATMGWGDAYSGNLCAYNMVLDEVQLYKGERSADWIATDYNNYSSSSTFYSAGTQEDLGPAPSIVLPDTVYVVVEQPMNIRYDQMSPQLSTADRWEYSCSAGVGSSDSLGFHYTPTSTGSFQVVFSVADAYYDTTVVDTTVVKSVPQSTGSGAKGTLFVGDSVMLWYPYPDSCSAYVPTSAKAAFDDDGGASMRLIGTKGCSPSVHEGRSGWTWNNFITSNSGANPFWDGTKLDFQNYITANSLVAPIDLCVIQLGYNDISFTAEMTPLQLSALADKAETFCAALLADSTGYPDCKIVISAPSLGNISLTAWNVAYSAYDRDVYEANFSAYNQTLIDRFDAGAYDARVDVCSSGLWVDRVSGYPSNNYLHPNSVGGEDMGEAFSAHLRSLMPQTTEDPRPIGLKGVISMGTRLVGVEVKP